MRSRLATALLLVPIAAAAQQVPCPPADINVKVLTSTSRPLRGRTQVDLLNGSGVFQRQVFTDDNGNAEFGGVESGRNYRLRVVDPRVEENVSDVFAIPCRDVPSFQLLTIKLKSEPSDLEVKREEERQAAISALELNVPGNAKKEFQKAVEAMGKKEFERAEKGFQRALELYPQYAMAWNHLGVLYMQQGKPAQGVEAFEKAVALNDRYPSALVNLGKVRMEQRKAAEAEQLLQKAVAADPRNAEAYAVLASVQYTRKEYAAAAETATRVHPLGDEQFAIAHWIAARSYEEQQKDAEAIAEYTIFLKEAPTSTLAEKARAALKKLRDANYPSEDH